MFTDPTGLEDIPSNVPPLVKERYNTFLLDKIRNMEFRTISYNGQIIGTGTDGERIRSELENLNQAEIIGDAASNCSLGLNLVSIGATVTGNIPAGETLGTAAGILDAVSFAAYHVGGNYEKRNLALYSVGLDLFPLSSIAGKASWNNVAKRFVDKTSKRFIKTNDGINRVLTPSLIGVQFSVASMFIPSE